MATSQMCTNITTILLVKLGILMKLGAQAGSNGVVVVLTRRDVRQAHTITLDVHDHLLVLSCINAEGGCLPNFYIFKGKQMGRTYIKKCETGSCMDEWFLVLQMVVTFL